jgi:diguanylate cyclase (GGDEF)-like protein/PAS domain S-box-containing protein
VKALAPVMRISAGLVLLTCSILVLLDLAGVLPRPTDAALQARIHLCETLASQAAAAAERNDFAAIRSSLRSAVERNEDLISAGVRAADGSLLLVVGPHRQLWNPDPDGREPTTHVRVPLFKAGRPWAGIEVRFEPLGGGGVLETLWGKPLLRLMLPISVLGFFAYGLYMRRTLRHLDPSAVIPTRVQAALDVMAEGVILVDEKGQIVLANAAFAELAGRPDQALLGLDAASLPWITPAGAEPGALPWLQAMRSGEPAPSTPLHLKGTEVKRSLVVKCAPVTDGRGRAKGAIATFDDVTELERKSEELTSALAKLEKSQEEIRLQNEELQVLARRDSLTGVSNRRYFLDRLQSLFEAAARDGRKLCCIMVDIDHFKRINDAHGHVAGDEVIRRVAEVLSSEVRSSDAICRYGGEEFLLVLQEVGVERAMLVAERLRRRVAAPAFARVPVTASFGLASSSFGARDADELIRQADEALYASKQRGRDRVTRWDRIYVGE